MWWSAVWVIQFWDNSYQIFRNSWSFVKNLWQGKVLSTVFCSLILVRNINGDFSSKNSYSTCSTFLVCCMSVFKFQWPPLSLLQIATVSTLQTKTLIYERLKQHRSVVILQYPHCKVTAKLFLSNPWYLNGSLNFFVIYTFNLGYSLCLTNALDQKEKIVLNDIVMCTLEMM